MIPQKQQALLKEQGYRWLASFLCLWLAVAYLWLALFYPLMCAPYTSTSSPPFQKVNAFAHTITPFEVVMSTPIYWLNDTSRYATVNASSTASWLIEFHDDESGPVLTFISAISTPALSWLKPVQPVQTVALLHAESYKQFRTSPPDQPPRFSLL